MYYFSSMQTQFRYLVILLLTINISGIINRIPWAKRKTQFRTKPELVSLDANLESLFNYNFYFLGQLLYLYYQNFNIAFRILFCFLTKYLNVENIKNIWFSFIVIYHTFTAFVVYKRIWTLKRFSYKPLSGL